MFTLLYFTLLTRDPRGARRAAGQACERADRLLDCRRAFAKATWFACSWLAPSLPRTVSCGGGPGSGAAERPTGSRGFGEPRRGLQPLSWRREGSTRLLFEGSMYGGADDDGSESSQFSSAEDSPALRGAPVGGRDDDFDDFEDSMAQYPGGGGSAGGGGARPVANQPFDEAVELSDSEGGTPVPSPSGEKARPAGGQVCSPHTLREHTHPASRASVPLPRVGAQLDGSLIHLPSARASTLLLPSPLASHPLSRTGPAPRASPARNAPCAPPVLR